MSDGSLVVDRADIERLRDFFMGARKLLRQDDETECTQGAPLPEVENVTAATAAPTKASAASRWDRVRGEVRAEMRGRKRAEIRETDTGHNIRMVI